jgi:hypothetical protein
MICAPAGRTVSPYQALEKDDIAGSVRLIWQIGDGGNALALEPLLILPGFHAEQVRSSSAVVKQIATPETVSDSEDDELSPKSPLPAALASFFT